MATLPIVTNALSIANITSRTCQERLLAESNLRETVQQIYLRGGDVGDALELYIAGAGITVAVVGLAGVAEVVSVAGLCGGANGITWYVGNPSTLA